MDQVLYSFVKTASMGKTAEYYDVPNQPMEKPQGYATRLGLAGAKAGGLLGAFGGGGLGFMASKGGNWKQRLLGTALGAIGTGAAGAASMGTTGASIGLMGDILS